MGTLTATALLDVWERGLARPLPERVLGLLAAAFAEISVDDLADLPIGRRDAHLLLLRERLFGPDVTVVAACPVCGEQIESAFSVDAVRITDADGFETAHSAEVDGYRAVFRLPTTRDLLTLTDADSARAILFARCVEIHNADGAPVQAAALSPETMAAIEARMSDADPQADVELALVCPSCGHQWSAIFDIASFLWKELHTWALRALREVHMLARSYGWREADVLALSGTRRQLYLELCGQ